MNRGDRIKEESARRSAAWLGPQNDNSGTNSLVIATPTNNSSNGFGPQSARVGNSAGNTMTVVAPSLDGPLPKEARMIISASVQGDEADQAELYARRLLSTSRRVRIYKEELQAAREEVEDYKSLVTQKQLVVAQLGSEAQQLEARIRELQNELHMAQMQQETALGEQRRMEGKQFEAQRRVEALQNTIDTIANESQRGKLLLRQLVPNLNIDNYAN